MDRFVSPGYAMSPFLNLFLSKRSVTKRPLMEIMVQKVFTISIVCDIGTFWLSCENSESNSQVVINAGLPDELYATLGVASRSHTMTGLSPYTLYDVRIRACLRGIINSCSTGNYHLTGQPFMPVP